MEKFEWNGQLYFVKDIHEFIELLPYDMGQALKRLLDEYEYNRDDYNLDVISNLEDSLREVKYKLKETTTFINETLQLYGGDK